MDDLSKYKKIQESLDCKVFIDVPKAKIINVKTGEEMDGNIGRGNGWYDSMTAWMIYFVLFFIGIGVAVGYWIWG